jgi:hypothetical protein
MAASTAACGVRHTDDAAGTCTTQLPLARIWHVST